MRGDDKHFSAVTTNHISSPAHTRLHITGKGVGVEGGFTHRHLYAVTIFHVSSPARTLLHTYWKPSYN